MSASWCRASVQGPKAPRPLSRDRRAFHRPGPASPRTPLGGVLLRQGKGLGARSLQPGHAYSLHTWNFESFSHVSEGAPHPLSVSLARFCGSISETAPRAGARGAEDRPQPGLEDVARAGRLTLRVTSCPAHAALPLRQDDSLRNLSDPGWKPRSPPAVTLPHPRHSAWAPYSTAVPGRNHPTLEGRSSASVRSETCFLSFQP